MSKVLGLILEVLRDVIGLFMFGGFFVGFWIGWFTRKPKTTFKQWYYGRNPNQSGGTTYSGNNTSHMITVRDNQSGGTS